MAQRKTRRRFLLTREVAALLRVDAHTVRRYHKAGQLKGVKLMPSRHLRFAEADVAALIKAS